MGSDTGINAARLSIGPLTSWLPRRRTDLVAGCAVAALAILVYANSLSNGFVNDDMTIIVKNPAIRALSNFRAIFFANYWPKDQDLLYRPVVILSYALSYALAGLSPIHYHLVNVLLHAGNSALVYRLSASLLKARDIALAGAAAFAVHPIHTEAVANAAGRAELLANAFLLLSWIWYLRRDEVSGRGQGRWLVVSVVTFGLALFTKEHAIVLPGLLVLSDLFRSAERGLRPVQAVWEKCWSAYVWYFLPILGYVAMRFAVLGALRSHDSFWIVNPLADTDLWSRLLTAVKILGRYLWLLLFPVHLSHTYGYNQIPISRSLAEPSVLVALLALLGMFALLAWNWRRRPHITFAIAIFPISVLPVSNLLFPIGTIMAERLLYLPSLSVCLLIGVIAASLAARPLGSLVAVGALSFLLVGYGARTIVRNRDWRGESELFRADVSTSPNSVKSRCGLGWILFNGGDLSGGRREFERCAEIAPTYPTALIGLGLIFEQQGHIDEAIRVYQQVGTKTEVYGSVRLSLGLAYLQKGMTADALREFRIAAQFGFTDTSELVRLAEGFLRAASIRDAQETLETAKRHSPDDLSIRETLASVYSNQGRWEDAQRELEAAATMRPGSPEIHLSLGRLYVRQGRLAEAKEALLTSIRLRPENADAHRALARVLQQQGRAAEAQREYRIADQQEGALRSGGVHRPAPR